MSGPRRPADLLRHQDVVLRRWRLADADTAYRIVAGSLEQLAPWLPWAGPDYSEQEAQDFVRRCEDDWESGTAFNYAIVAPDGQTAGSCGLMARIGPGGLEIGYWLLHQYQGRGLATMAASALTAEAFRLGFDRVEISHDAANTRSAAVPARLGFTEVQRYPSDPGTSGTSWSGIRVLWRLTAPTAD